MNLLATIQGSQPGDRVSRLLVQRPAVATIYVATAGLPRLVDPRMTLVVQPDGTWSVTRVGTSGVARVVARGVV